MDGPNTRTQVNGSIRHRRNSDSDASSHIQGQINFHKIKNHAEQLKIDALQALRQELNVLMDNFIHEIEVVEGNNGVSNSVSFEKLKSRKKRQDGELPDKVFVPRRSVLTDLFEISHVKTIYHIFVAILIVFCLNTMVYDIVREGRLNLNFELMQWALGKFPKVMALWVCMQICTLAVYPLSYYWYQMRPPGKAGKYDMLALLVYIVYQMTFLVWPVLYVRANTLPPASTVVITTEQLRLMMKVHSFIRENAQKVLFSKKDDDQPDSSFPGFSKYLYFLFAPTLVYRNSYPRTQTIRWNYVVTNFAQVLACLFYIYYIFERFCVPVFHNFNREHVTPQALLVSLFGCMLPGTLVLFIGFFAILHSWLNAFAEMLRFADRLFYKDWWNSTSFASYYRTWNIVVHDWLYTYIYKDFYRILGPKNRAGAMAMVFFISAIFHEYVLVLCFNFFYPVLFVMFMGAGFAFTFLTDKGVSRSWNVFLWVALMIGTGLLMCLYSMEWYARQRCPVNIDNFADYVIPRSWTCNFEAMTDI